MNDKRRHNFPINGAKGVVNPAELNGVASRLKAKQVRADVSQPRGRTKDPAPSGQAEVIEIGVTDVSG